MKLPFKGTFRQTQGFAENPTAYAKFGLKGHNGLDHGVPTGTDLFAMITGRVIEAQLDATGYGNYVKIENDKEGALVGHLSVLGVKPGDTVVEGETFIGKSGNTGNSTGPHTHTGYFTKPRDRSNGYSGYIDFSHLLTNMAIYKDFDLTNQASMKSLVDFWTEWVKEGKLDKLKADLVAVQQANEENIQDEKELLAELDEARETVSTLDKQLRNSELNKEQLTDTINKQSVTIAQKDDEIKLLTLKLSAIPQTPETSPTISNVIALFRLWLKDWLRNGS
jgi:septal ring factor EnvC (AmiA/AmiB activator)